jgi:hypothetical protein
VEIPGFYSGDSPQNKNLKGGGKKKNSLFLFFSLKNKNE